MTDLGRRIREKREREGLNLREAGAASGVAFSTLGRIEKGGKPSLKVYQLAEAWLNGEAPLLPTPPMTLRDYFAGQALVGLLASTNYDKNPHGYTGDVSRSAYAIADAMLAARTQDAAS